MSQRILLEFDALDKYSRDILAKHAKKRSLNYLQGLQSLHIPLTFDFGLDSNETTEGRSASSKLPLETETPGALSPRNKIFAGYAKPVIQPSTAAGCSVRRGGVPAPTERKSQKSRCVSATRRKWHSEVESVPKLETLCQEENNPILGFQDVSFVSPRSPMLAVNSTSDTMELKCPSRYENTNLDRVSLSIDDELLKSDAKVITAREKTCGAHTETVMDAMPETSQKENIFVFFSTLSDLQKHAPAKQIHSSSSHWLADSATSTMGMSSVSQNNRNFAKDLMHSRHVKSSSAKKRSLSANVQLNIQFLSADGTKQKGEVLREEKAPTDRPIRFRDLKKTLPESKPRPKVVSAWEERAEHGQVGTVINGINPKKTADHDPGSHSRPQQASKPPGPSSARPPVPRPSSVAEIQRWRFIAISKPLSPLGDHQGSLEVGGFVAPHLVKDTPRSERRSRSPSMTLTTRPVIFEARRGKQSSLAVEIPPRGANNQAHQVEADRREDNGGAGEAENVHLARLSPILGNPELKSPVPESNGEEAKKSPIFTVHRSTIPIISIPTAQTDTSD